MPREELAVLWGEAVRDWEETRPGWGGRPHGACSSHKGILFNSGRSGEPLKNSCVEKLLKLPVQVPRASTSQDPCRVDELTWGS